MFVDEVVIKVIAGKGGDGCTSFRREKYVPNGGPNGGNGGRGASIIFKVDEGLKTLLDLKYQKEIKGKKGENGKGSNMNGKAAEDVIIKVPLGTVVKDLDTNLIIADLTKKNDEVVVATGGRGGRGNTAFKTHSNTAPNFSENGEPGEEKTLKIELKLLADVGLVGLPSVGKSTLLSKISSAKPKIASYHFTTLVPNLGVVKTKDNRTFVVADLPGLIEGAAEGTGLGDKFLRHIERTKLIVHIVDMSGIEGRDPYEDYEVIRKELKEYSEKLANKEEIVVANKMDMPSSIDNLKEFKKKIDKEVIEISGLTGAGIDDLLLLVADKLDSIEETNLYEDDEIESHILYKFKEEQPFTIEVDEDGVYVIHSESIEKLFKMTKFTDEGMRRFSNKLRRMGVDEELQKMGIEEGDIVRILDYEFEYTE
ncbi:MAG: GTPase ObgE [Bacilli bacterium]|nr:GTPase ObgE [Bacilli bacterium]